VGLAVDGDAVPYLVMELVEGPTWAACCLDASLDAARITELGAELAEALAYVHGQGVVHRDIKPANILLDAQGRTKLADFGVALLADTARHTAHGLTIGTAPYLSPEQVVGAPSGAPADVYALGLVLLEALTGQREFPGTTTETALARLHRSPRVPPGTPQPLDGVLRGMTERDPTARPTAAAAAASLRRADLTAALRLPRPSPDPGPLLSQPATSAMPLLRPDLADGGAEEPAAERAGALSAGRRPARTPARTGRARLAAALLAVGVLAAGLAAQGPWLQGRPDPAPAAPAGPGGDRLEGDLAELRSAVTP